MPALTTTGMDQLPPFMAQSAGGSSPMLVGIGSLLVLLLLILLSLAIGYSFNKYWIRAGTPKPNAAANQAGVGVCGRCGYPARGITTFECPECGADLREVGIVSAATSRRQTAGQSGLIVLYSVVFLVVSSILYSLIDSNLPLYSRVDAHMSLEPASGQYDANIYIEATEVLWNRRNHASGLGFSRSYANINPHTLKTSLVGVTPNHSFTDIYVRVAPATTPPGASTMPIFEINPDNLTATWSGLNGKPHTTNGPFTDKDVLQFLGAAGADPTQQQIIDEANQLFTLLHGLATGKNQFHLAHFTSHNGGSGMSSSSGPQWFGPVYALVCLLLWGLGLTWLVRRGRQGTQTKS